MNCPDCPMVLRGLSVPGAGPGPTILKRTDQRFMQALIEELSGAQPLETVGNSRATIEAGEETLKLYQPVHRTFYIAALEIFCDVFGGPRLDPARIESAGLVLRRVYVQPDSRTARRRLSAATRKQLQNVATHAAGVGGESALVSSGAASSLGSVLQGGLSMAMMVQSQERALIPTGIADGEEQLEGWMQAGSQLQGWMPLRGGDEDLDPDPKYRRAPLRAGSPFIDQLLSASGRRPRAEDVAPLFVAQPAVCQATGKTVLYGLIPVTSLDKSEVPDTPPPFADDEVVAHLSRFLTPGAPPAVPHAGKIVTYAIAGESGTGDFVTLLRQLAVELDAFGHGAEASALAAALNGIALPFTLDVNNLPDFTALGKQGEALQNALAAALKARGVEGFAFWGDFGTLAFAGSLKTVTVTLPAGDFLRAAVPVLIERQGEQPGSYAPPLLMPDAWPQLSNDQAGAIVSAVKAAMTARLAVVAPHEGRFDDVGRRYRVRAFVRIKGEPGCPPATLWSEYSEPFSIAQWYESGDAPPTQINLPDINTDFLKKLKPNVSFTMPDSLFNLLQGDPQDLLKGKGQAQGGSPALIWICSFSIPIITLCAFIMLYIFLTLFDLIFRWLLWIKICIPFPKK